MAEAAVITQFVEATDGVMYGKFLVCRLDSSELATETAMPEAPPGQRLLTYGGRRRFAEHSTLVVDLQRATAFAWPLGPAAWRMVQYAEEHYRHIETLVCPMYLPFVAWLHDQATWQGGRGDIRGIPRYVKFEPGQASRLLAQLLEGND